MTKQVNLGLATIEQYAAIHDVEPRTVYNWMKDPDKKLKVVKLGKHTFIKVDKKLLEGVLK